MVVGYIPAILFAAAIVLSIYAYSEAGRKKFVLYSYPVLGVGFVVAFVTALQQLSQGGVGGLLGVASFLVNLVLGAIATGVVLVVHRIGRRA